MTNEQLICRLQTFPLHLNVCLLDSGVCGGEWEISKVEKISSPDHDGEVILLSNDIGEP